MGSAYFEPTYIALHYFEGGSTEPPTVPSDTRVVIDRSVILDGTDITDHVVKFSVTRQLDTPYNVLTMELKDYSISPDLIRNKDKRMLVTIGTDEYSFIIMDADTTYKNDTSILGKTQGCILDVPFSVNTTEPILGNAHEVMTDLMGGVSHVNNTANFIFGKGSFTRDGTALSAVTAILSVSGANYYEAWGEIFLEKKFRIAEFDTPNFIINDNILTNREIVDDYDGSPLVNTVVFNSATDDIYSEPKITMMLPESGRPFFMFNPQPYSTNQINSNLGDFSFTDKIITFDGVVTQERYITTDGAIKAIHSVELNGEAVDSVDYSFEAGHNVVLFTADVAGSVKVSYTTSAVVNYTRNGYYSSTEKARIYKVQYLNQLLEESVPVPEDTDDNLETDPDGKACLSTMPSGITKDAPFDIVLSQGSLGSILFISDDSAQARQVNVNIPANAKGSFNADFLMNISKADSTIQTTTSATIEDLGRGGTHYGFYLPYNITPTGYKIGDIVTDFNSVAVGDGRTIMHYVGNPDALGQSATISYEVPATTYTIPACGVDNKVKKIEVYSCDWGMDTIEYPDETDGDILSCTIPQTFTLDVGSLLGVSTTKCIGKVITGYGGSFTVDDFGKINVEVTTYEKVVLDCSAIEKGREIYIDTTNAEVT